MSTPFAKSAELVDPCPTLKGFHRSASGSVAAQGMKYY
jgi:hypothetical protein